MLPCSSHLEGHWLYMPTLVAASTGMRRGEILGLRWQDMDMSKGTVQVTQAVEVVGGKIGVKLPKTERSARTIKIPTAVVVELERHRKEQLEQRLKLGLGGRPELVFTTPTGGCFIQIPCPTPSPRRHQLSSQLPFTACATLTSRSCSRQVCRCMSFRLGQGTPSHQ